MKRQAQSGLGPSKPDVLDRAGKGRQNFFRLALSKLGETMCLITALSLKNRVPFCAMRMGEYHGGRMGSVVPGHMARQDDGAPCLLLEQSEDGARTLSLFEATIP